jgi:hypothetical protein
VPDDGSLSMEVCACCGRSESDPAAEAVLCKWDAFANSGTGEWRCVLQHWQAGS